MTKELLLEVVTQKLFFEAALITITYLICWCINLKLGFQILGVKIGLIRIIPASCIMFLNSFFVKPYLPILAYGMELVILFALILIMTGKVHIIKAVWTVLLIILLNAAGNIIFVTPLCIFNNDITSFSFKSPYGNIILSATEVFFPTLALFILPKYNVSLIPPLKKKFTRNDLISLITFGAMYYILFCVTMRFFLNLKDNLEHTLMDLVLELVAASMIIFGYYIILTHAKKQYDYDQEIIQLLSENRKLTELNQQIKASYLDAEELVTVFKCVTYQLENIKGSFNDQSRSDGTPTNGNQALTILTQREMSVVELIARGKNNKEIAAALDLSEGRIKNIITQILNKLELKDRTQLAVHALTNNLIRKNNG